MEARKRGRDRKGGAARFWTRQLPDGGFNIYAGGPSEVSASVKAYFALKLAGVPVDDRAHGGGCASAFWRWAEFRRRTATSRSTSACSICIRAQYCPSIPPEVALLPFNLLYQMSSWTRAIVVSLSIVHAANPQRPVPDGLQSGRTVAARREPGTSQATTRWLHLAQLLPHRRTSC